MGELSYLRKAADMGNRDAQYSLAMQLLENIDDKNTFSLRMNVSEKLLNCSSNQGNGIASLKLGISNKIDNKFSEAVKAFHQGAKNGNIEAAGRLSTAFKKVIPESNKLDYLAINKADPERAIRYEMIEEYLSRNDFLDPKVPDLDEIVPLPPAKLPAWDGKIAFQRWFEGTSPEKPSDELMKKLAEKAGLDWQTGLPLQK